MKNKKRLLVLALSFCLCVAAITVGCKGKANNDISNGESSISVESTESDTISETVESTESDTTSETVESTESDATSETDESAESSESLSNGENTWSDENADEDAWT